jgi:succinyl-diaminopimelate desuccinylase
VVELKGVAGHASAPERARNPIALLPEVLAVLHQFTLALPSDPLLGPSTMAPTQIETLPRSRNVIPDRVRLILDWRVLPSTSRETAVMDVRSALSGVARPDGCSIDVSLSTEPQATYTGLQRERSMFTPGFLLASDHAVVRAATAVVARQTGRTPALRPWTFATDGGHACGVHGIPCIGYAPGEERYAHTNRERLELSQAERIFGHYPALIFALQRIR